MTETCPACGEPAPHGPSECPLGIHPVPEPTGYLVACEKTVPGPRKCGMPGRVAKPTDPFRCDAHKETK